MNSSNWDLRLIKTNTIFFFFFYTFSSLDLIFHHIRWNLTALVLDALPHVQDTAFGPEEQFLNNLLLYVSLVTIYSVNCLFRVRSLHSLHHQLPMWSKLWINLLRHGKAFCGDGVREGGLGWMRAGNGRGGHSCSLTNTARQLWPLVSSELSFI